MSSLKTRSSKPKVALVAAMSENRVIGRDNQLPWHLPADLKFFKQLTSGHVIIMGRKTFESMGKPLPDRTNIIVTRDRNYEAPGALVVGSLDEALQLRTEHAEVFVLGGGELFRAAMPIADRIYLTLVHAHINGDVQFPEMSEREWMIISDAYRPADEHNTFAMSFRRYERRPNS